MAKGRLQIFNAPGQPVYRQDLATGTQHTILTGGWSEGVYVYRWTTADQKGVYTGTLLMQR